MQIVEANLLFKEEELKLTKSDGQIMVLSFDEIKKQANNQTLITGFTIENNTVIINFLDGNHFKLSKDATYTPLSFRNARF